MQLHFSSFPVVLCYGFFIFVVIKLGKRLKSNPKLPPGPWKLPLIGNMHQMMGSQPHITLRDLANKYGGLMFLQVGEIPTVVVSSVEYAKEVMKTHDVVFASRPRLNAAKIFSYNFSSITFSPYGDYWRQLRKICVMELLSMNRIRSSRPIREEEVSNCINLIHSEVGSTINLTRKIFSITYVIVSKIAFSKRAEKVDEFIWVIRKFSRLVSGFSFTDVFPSLKLFHMVIEDNSELKKLNARASKILGDIINEHIKARVETKTSTMKEDADDEDLIDVLLKFHESNAEFTLTMDNIKAIIQDILAAGGETSSATVDWAMVEMIKNPRIMETAQAEVRRVFEDINLTAQETRMSELKYLKLVIKETLRLHPPGPLLLPRENRERCEINDYEIPMNTRVIVNAWAIGRDPKCWGFDAETFYPERFIDNMVDFKGKDFEFLPFGAGKRFCPGMAFGLMQVECLLSQLLYHFDWKLPAGLKAEDLDMTDLFGVTVQRRDDLYLVPTPYHSSHVSMK